MPCWGEWRSLRRMARLVQGDRKAQTTTLQPQWAEYIFTYLFFYITAWLVFGRSYFSIIHVTLVFPSLRTAGMHDPLGLEAWLMLQMWFGLLAGSGINFSFTTHSPDCLNSVFSGVLWIAFSQFSSWRKNTGYYYLKSLMFDIFCHLWCKEYHMVPLHTLWKSCLFNYL